MSKFREKSKVRVNWSFDKLYMMIRQSYINCKDELIENCPCNNLEELKNKIRDKFKNKSMLNKYK